MDDGSWPRSTRVVATNSANIVLPQTKILGRSAGANVRRASTPTSSRPASPRQPACGRILNPLLVTGQQHGGLAQGVAQALYEEVRYDPEGQPLTDTLADYHMPSAADLITFETTNTETPTPLNALGAKGIGESATIGSTPAVQSAVIDALAPLGVRHLDLPCTPERVWRAVHDARNGHASDHWREPPAVFAGLPVRGGGAREDDATV
jgi:carbon-monoxide dehydrogenase large subunit